MTDGKPPEQNDVVYWEPVRIVLPLPPTILSPNGRTTNLNYKAKAVREYREHARLVCVESGVVDYGWEFAESQETFYFPTKHRRDVRNAEAMLKPAYDGFRDAGLIVDDDYNHLQHAVTRFRYSKENPRVEITLTKTTKPKDL